MTLSAPPSPLPVSRLRVLCLALAASLAVGCASEPEPEPPRPPVPMTKRLEDARAVLERLRGQRLKSLPVYVKLTPQEYEAWVGQRWAKEWPAAQANEETLLWRLLGLLPRAEGGVQEQALRKIVGDTRFFYDPRGHRLVQVGEREPDEATLVHELVHALQRERTPLPPIPTGLAGLEANWARSALIEGEATCVEQLARAKRHLLGDPKPLTPADVSQELRVLRDRLGGALQFPQRGDPLGMRFLMVEPYLHGSRAVASAHLQGQWAAVDGLVAASPTTSHELMTYARDGVVPSEEASPPDLPDLGGVLDLAAAEPVGLGERAAQLVLHVLYKRDQSLFTRAWAADRALWLRQGERRVLLWGVRFRRSSAAKAYVDALREVSREATPPWPQAVLVQKGDVAWLALGVAPTARAALAEALSPN